MVLKLYMVIASPPVRSVLLTVKALGLSVERIHVNLSKGEQLNKEFLKINPQHTVPTLDDNGKVIWDSHAINVYLVTKYGKDDSLYPEDPYKRAIVDQMLHFDTGKLFAPALRSLMPVLRNEIKSFPQENSNLILEAYEILEKILEGRQWAAGDAVTLADISLIPTVTSLSRVLVPLDEAKFPYIAAWMKRAEALPYYDENIEGLDLFTNVFLQKLKS